MNKSKKGERKNKAKDEETAPKVKKPKTEAAPKVPTPRLPRGAAAKAAAQAVLASLATPAKGPEPQPKKRATPKRNASSAKAKPAANKVAKIMKKARG